MNFEKFKKWFSNYWYHYKWVTIVVLFFATVIGIGVYQMIDKETYDSNILYAGPAILNKDQTAAIESAFVSVMPSDFNQDKKKSVFVNRFTILSDEQIMEKQEEAENENDTLYYDPTQRTNTLSQIGTLFSVGEVSICLVDEYVYNIYRSQDAFVPLEELLGYTPEYARDKCSVYLKDTPFGQYFDALQVLPEDTILCLRKSAVFSDKSKKKANEQYAYDQKLFKAIIEYEAPEL